MRCLIIDNYDSFTWNLVHYATQVFGDEPIVVRNDQYSWLELTERFAFDCVIVSPGPGSVVNISDFHCSRDALKQDDIPVLGVCLGFQGLAHIYGAGIDLAPEPYHGRRSEIYHQRDAMFAHVPSPFAVVRYHSLVVTRPLPAELIVTAQTDSGLVMALRHRTLPKWGLQFHPESILTEHGHRLISNFRDLAYRHVNGSLDCDGYNTKYDSHNGKVVDTLPKKVLTKKTPSRHKLHVVSDKLDEKVDPEQAFISAFSTQDHCFWLDSQTIANGRARYSFMGAVDRDSLHTYRLNQDTADGFPQGQQFLNQLELALEKTTQTGGEQLPFEFRGGLVGFFSYEMRTLFAQDQATSSDFPDAVWMSVGQFVAFDHVTDSCWLVAVGEDSKNVQMRQWMAHTKSLLVGKPKACKQAKSQRLHNKCLADSIEISMRHDAPTYRSLIDDCRAAILAGESYELCLTNKFSAAADIDAFELYRVMRRENAAPFGAFLRCGKYCVLSTSPEQFLKIAKHGQIQTKPIKGTASRKCDAILDKKSADALANSEKDRAENLMIVDLMRSDLSKVSVPGSVTVSKLMAVESYETVHHMVSTVESQLRPQCSLIDVLRATFPGGSISGAPKRRTMKILNQLEGIPRGVYCGVIGYLGYDRVADLNIGIRTLTYDGEKIEFGAGGAITYLSDSNNEFEEVLLKAEALLHPIWHYLSGSSKTLKYEIEKGALVLR